MTLTFELERRLMTVRDVETLAPGYTFAFGGDALARAALEREHRNDAAGEHRERDGSGDDGEIEPAHARSPGFVTVAWM